MPAVLWPIREDRSLSAYAKLAYAMLWTRLPDAHPSMQTLADDMSVSVSTAHRAVRELQAAGLVKVVPRATALGDPDSNLYDLTPLSHRQDPPVPQTGPPLSVGHPNNGSSTTELKGAKALASRRARPAAGRDEIIATIRRAVSICYGEYEASEQNLTDGQAVALHYLLINNRTPQDPVRYLMKIFTDTPDLDTHLANAGTEEDWQ